MTVAAARRLALALPLAALCAAGTARANTITQNTSWTIKRSGVSTTYRVVAYGDSIFAGYNGALFSVARRAAPYVDGEYLSSAWGANVEVVRRAKSGARADDIYNNKIVGERSYMQASNVRVVMFEMCGNDYLQARDALASQSGTCSYAPIDSALAACTTYMEKAMQAVNQYATSARAKIIMNIYYPGYAADDANTTCVDAATGQRVNKQEKFLPYLARSNYRACALAAVYGFACADAFAEMMGADYDSDGDGLVDTDGLRWSAAETEDQYVERITVARRATIRDANAHLASASASYDYLLSDDTHPTYYKGTISLGLFTGTGTGSGAADFTDAQLSGGKNPEWNKWGHEKAGWSISGANPAAP